MSRLRWEAHYGHRVVRCYADRPRMVAELLSWAAATSPRSTALVEGQQRYTYAELNTAVPSLSFSSAA